MELAKIPICAMYSPIKFFTKRRLQTNIILRICGRLPRECMKDIWLQQVDSNTSPVKVNGDHRFDSSGHSALYCVHSFMDCDSSEAMACELVKVICSLFLSFAVHLLFYVCLASYKSAPWLLLANLDNYSSCDLLDDAAAATIALWCRTEFLGIHSLTYCFI